MIDPKDYPDELKIMAVDVCNPTEKHLSDSKKIRRFDKFPKSHQGVVDLLLEHGEFVLPTQDELDLREAAECMALIFESEGHSRAAEDYRNGVCDNEYEIKGCLLAIKRERERNVETTNDR